MLYGRLCLLLLPFVLFQPQAFAIEALVLRERPGGYFDQYGTLSARAAAVSADGMTVVGDASFSCGGVTFHDGYRFRLSEGAYSLTLVSLFLGEEHVHSYGTSVNGNGSLAVGYGETTATERQAGYLTGAGVVAGIGYVSGYTDSTAYGVNRDSTGVSDGVIVGAVDNLLIASPKPQAFRWTQTGGMLVLGFLPSHDFSTAYGVNSDGTVVVGESGKTVSGGISSEAFRWVKTSGLNTGTMTGLGHLGVSDERSGANAVNANGKVVVGWSGVINGSTKQAFRWVSTDANPAGTMTGLGYLTGSVVGTRKSVANAVSGDGAVVVGYSSFDAAGQNSAAFRWTSDTGMLSVSDWLGSTGGVVPAGLTLTTATGVSDDGKVIVGIGTRDGAEEAWMAIDGKSLVTSDLVASLFGMSSTSQSIASVVDVVVHGLHHRPLQMQGSQKSAWLTGDFGKHDGRDATLVVGEVGGSFSLFEGQLDVGVGFGTGTTRQDLAFGGDSQVKGEHLYLELSHRAKGTPFVTTLSGMHGGYEAEVRRGYELSLVRSSSTGKTDVAASGLRLREDWVDAWKWGGVTFSPMLAYTLGRTSVDGYTETGGGLPAQFNKQSNISHETRLGAVAEKVLDESTRLRGQMEWAHRFDRNTGRVSGTVTGISTFDFAGASVKQNWMRWGMELERDLNKSSTAFVMFNATTPGEDPTYWLSMGLQLRF